MATDFLGQNLNIGDDVIFLTYNRTSTNLEKGKITKLFPHTAEIGMKRRAEYKIVKIPADVVTVIRCKDCKYRDGTPGQPNIQCGNMHDDDFCSYGEKKDKANES